MSSKKPFPPLWLKVVFAIGIALAIAQAVYDTFF